MRPDYFKYREFIKQPLSEAVPDTVIHKIYIHHISPMNRVREVMGIPIIVNSGYREKIWEIQQGRDGKSEHTFTGFGAADYFCSDLPALLRNLVTYTDYSRIALYSTFIHCDYKFPQRGQRLFNSTWTEKTITELLQ